MMNCTKKLPLYNWLRDKLGNLLAKLKLLRVQPHILRTSLIVGCVVHCLTFPAAHAQPIDVSLDDDFRMVIRGEGQRLLGIEFDSANALVPGTTDPVPFEITLSNTLQNVGYGVLGSDAAVVLDGPTTLPVGWNRLGLIDVRYSYGLADGTLIGPTSLFQLPSRDDVRISLSDAYDFVLNGSGQQLQKLDLFSPGGGLIPGSTAAPFSQATLNTPNGITYVAAGNVAVDGQLTLPVQWNRDIGDRNIGYQYREVGAPQNAGPFRLGQSEYPEPPVSFPVQVRVRPDNSNEYRFELIGQGHELRSFQLDSPSGSLIPAADAGPFNSLMENTSNRISFAADGFVRLDGRLTTSAGYDRIAGQRDITYQYGQAGFVGDRGPFSLSGNDYPLVVMTPIQVRLRSNAENNHVFELSGRGQELRSFQLDSASGSLIPASDAGPFASLTENSPNRISFATDGFVVLDGTLRTSAGFAPLGQHDVTYQYRQIGIAEERGPFGILSNFYPRIPAVDVSLNDDLNFVVTGIGQSLDQLTLRSNGSSLVPSDNPAPFSSFGDNTESRIEYEGGPVTIDGEVTLAAKWNRVRGIRDVHFDQKNAQEVFPTSGRVNGYPPRAPTTPLDVGIDTRTHKFVLTGSGNELRQFQLTSSNGALIPATDPGPFTTVTENSSSKITYESAEFVTLDGSLLLSSGYNVRVGGNDVLYRYLEVGNTSSSIFRRIRQFPAFSDIQVSLDQDSRIVLQGQGEKLLGIELRSESGSLIPGGTNNPFDITLANSTKQVTYGVLGETSAIVLDGTITLSTAWNPLGEPDVEYTFGISGGVAVGPISLFQQLPENVGPIGVGLSPNDRWVIKGNGQKLEQFNVFSRSGGLLPADTPAPFTELTQNDANAVRFVTNEQVSVDGEVTLGAGWNRFHLIPDASYSYRVQGSELDAGPFSVPNDLYPPVSLVRVDLSPDYHWILKGDGQKLEQFDLFSENGGLVATDTPAPFSEVTLNDANAIRFISDGSVTLDGELTLAAGWNRNLGLRDVKYWYREQGFDQLAGPYVVLSSVYPVQPPSGRVGVTISRDDNTFVLRGSGHELRSFQLTSPSGSLTPAQSPGPFNSLSENTPSTVAFAADGFVILDGELKTDVAYNIDVAGEDVSYRYEQVGFADLRGPFDVQPSQYPPNPKKSPLRMRIDNDLNFVVDGIGQLVSTLQLLSPAGSLAANDDPAPFTEFLSKTPVDVSIAAADNLRIEGSVRLPVAWNEAGTDITFLYTLDGVEDPFGPIRIPGGSYPSPNVINVAVSITGSISLIGRGQLIDGLEVRSASGSLERLGTNDIDPFDNVLSSTETLVSYTTDNPVGVSFVRLPFRWNPSGQPDLEFFFDATGSRAIVAQIDYIEAVVPEPNSLFLALLALWAPIAFIRQRLGRRVG